MDDKYEIEGEELSVSDVTIIRKYDLAYRPPQQSDHDYFDTPNFNRALHGFSDFKKAAIHYIAGFVGRILSKRILCFPCNEALGSTSGTSLSGLLVLKDRGGLFKPTPSVVKVCEETEIRFQRLLNSTGGKLPQGNHNYVVKEISV